MHDFPYKQYQRARHCMMLMGFMLTLLLISTTGLAADVSEGLPDSLQIHVGEKVVYCTAQLKNIDERALLLSMQNGLAVGVVWQVKVGKLRDYWLDERVAEISVVRRVEPDLLTRSWLLVNVSSGISLRIHDVRLVMDFLTNLRQFPMLDRSLLLADTRYRASVDVDVQIGEVQVRNLQAGDNNEAWWSGLWSSTTASMQQEFTLP